MKFELKTVRIASFTRRNVRLCIVKPFSSPKDESAFILHSIFRHYTDYRNRSFQYFCMKFSQAVYPFMRYAVTERIFGNYDLLRRFPN